MVDALEHDRFGLERDAVLWQRPIRLAVAASIVALVIVFGTGDRARTTPLAVGAALLYVACVELSARIVRKSAAPHDRRLPALLVTADILTAATQVWLACAPGEAAILLVPSLLVVQLASYYFGRGLGIYCASLAIAAYLLAGLLLPAWAPGPPATWHHVLFTIGMFTVVAGVLIAAHSGFRARMDRLRLVCRLVEEGDLAPAVAIGIDRRPDDLTLLAQSFDTMRMRLAEQIGTDPLTSCLNRRALESRLRAEWRQAKRRGTTVAVLAIDVDRFKQINDTRGHPVGDVVLQEIASIFKATARDTDAVARVGGDEFVVVLPDTGWQGALTFAERLRRKVEDFDFGHEMGAIRITISLGAAMARGTDPISPDMLLAEADRSLYKAKSGGRNRVFA